MFEELLSMIEAMLTDDHGINQQTYFHLLDLRDTLQGEERDRLREILSRVDGTDGRFYIPEN